MQTKKALSKSLKRTFTSHTPVPEGYLASDARENENSDKINGE